VGALIIYTIPLLLLVARLIPSWDKISQAVTELSDSLNTSNHSVANSFNWILPGLATSLFGCWVGFLLRFDYELAIQRNPDIDISQSLDIVEQPTSQCFSVGINIPNCTPKGFRKTYFYTAMLSAAFVQLAYVPLSSLIIGEVPLPRVVFSLLSLLGMIDFSVLSVVCLALYRDDMALLVHYKEQWRVDPDKSADVEKGGDHTRNEKAVIDNKANDVQAVNLIEV